VEVSSNRKRVASKISACRAVVKSTGHMAVFDPEDVALEAFRREHRAWRVVPLVAVLILAIFFGAMAIAGCAHLGAFGRGLEGAGDVMQRQAHPGVALAGVFVSLTGAVVTAIGKKYEKPIIATVGAGAVAAGLGGAAVQNAPMLTSEAPPPIVAPAEPGEASVP
jgi:hypothetical protein